MKLVSLVNLKSLKEEYSSEYIEGDKVKFNPPIMIDKGFENDITHYDDLMGVVTKSSQDELEIKLNKSITPPGGGNINHILLLKSEGDYEMIEKVEPGAFWDVQSGGELKEESTGAFGMSAKDLAATYSLKRLQQIRDEVMGDMEQQAEPEGGRIADMYADQLHGLDQAIAIKRGDSGTPLTYDQAIGRVPKDQFTKSSKFDRINEATEKSWNAVDVSRKAEKEISNKEWNERTGKKLDMLKALNAAGKFKKDWDEEKLQGWVDQNYSWEKLSRQFKLNEVYSEMFEQNTGQALQVTTPDGTVAMITDPRDIEDFLLGKGTVYGEDQDGAAVELNKETSLDVQMVANEGSCGYGPDGVPGDTPGETRGMPADKRTMGMMREVIKKEIKKLHEAK